MMKLVAIMAFVAIALALPHIEDQVVPETGLVQSPESIAAAESNAAEQADTATSAAAVEEDWKNKEAVYVNQTKALNKEARDLQTQATAKNAEDAKAALDYQAEATNKISETNLETTAAEEEYAKLQREYATAIAGIESQDAAAAAESKAEAARYKKEMDHVKVEVDAEAAAGEKIKTDAAAANKKLKQDQADIAYNYKSQMKTLEAQSKADREQLAEEQTAMQAKLAKTASDQAGQAAVAQAAIAAEAQQNAANAAADKAAFDKRSSEELALKAEAHSQYQTKKALEAAALAATREGTQKKFSKEAAAAEAQYQAAMGSAAAEQASADHAHKQLEDEMAAQQDNQDNFDKESAASMADDAEIKSCAVDGSECLKPDGGCQKTDGVKGPFMADDLVSCTDTKPADQAFAGESWVGLPPPEPIKPMPAPTPECLAAIKDWKADYPDYAFAFNPAHNETARVQSISCKAANGKKLKEKKKALTHYFDDIVPVCPPWCIPHSQTSNGLVQDTNGVCIRGTDVLMFKEQISSLPEWTAWGVGQHNLLHKLDGAHFEGNRMQNICSMAKGFVDGFRDGVTSPRL